MRNQPNAEVEKVTLSGVLRHDATTRTQNALNEVSRDEDGQHTIECIEDSGLELASRLHLLENDTFEGCTTLLTSANADSSLERPVKIQKTCEQQKYVQHDRSGRNFHPSSRTGGIHEETSRDSKNN